MYKRQVQVADLDSRNGVRVDGTKRNVHLLREGQRLRLGEVVLILVRIEGTNGMLARGFRENLVELEALERKK